MASMPTPQLLTAEEYLAQPFLDDGRRRELIEGEVVVTDPSFQHQQIVGELFAALHSWCRATPDRGIASLNIDTAVGSSRSLFSPDLQWYADPTRLGPRDRRPQPPGDLIVEVRSPSTWSYDIGVKRSRYESLPEVAELWLVDTPARTVIVCRRSSPDATAFDVSLELSGSDELTSPLLPGFSLPADAVFGDVSR